MYFLRALQGLEEQVKHQAPELEKKSKQAGFLHTKGKEYKSHIQSLKVSLLFLAMHCIQVTCFVTSLEYFNDEF